MRLEVSRVSVPRLFLLMADDKHNDNGKNDKKGAEIRVPPRTWLLWIGIIALVPLVWRFHSQAETKYRILSYPDFVQLV
ncbi:MAG: hypothetical protein DME23_00680, partial [Verrucomicrobia bacterium]